MNCTLESLGGAPNASSVVHQTGVKIEVEEFKKVLTFHLLRNLAELASNGFSQLHSYIISNMSLLGQEVNIYSFSDPALTTIIDTGIFVKIIDSGEYMGRAVLRRHDGQEVQLDMIRMRGV